MEDPVNPLNRRHPLEQPFGRIDGCRLDVRHAYRLELRTDTALRRISLVGPPGRDAIAWRGPGRGKKTGRPPEAAAPWSEEERVDQPQQIFAASSDEMLVTPVSALSVTRATPVL